MGVATSRDQSDFRGFDENEFTVAWLTFKGDAVEKDDNRQAARKQGLLSSKLLKNLFGESTIKAFEACDGDFISREAFISTLLRSYLGNTEDRIAFIFTMYTITYGNERVGEDFISEPDYLDLLDYVAQHGHVHQKLYDAFEECKIPSGSMLNCSQFLSWVRSYPAVLQFLVDTLPAVSSQVSLSVDTPPSMRTSNETSPPNRLSSSDPLNTSPSCRNQNEKQQAKGHISSFDFIGGEDSGDDSDELYDSDQISELDELFESSFQAPSSGGVQIDDKSDSDVEMLTSHATSAGSNVPATPLTTGTSVLHSFGSQRPMDKEKKRTSRSNVQKMGRLGKAVGGGISKVGRNLLHAGKQTAVGNKQMAPGMTGGSAGAEAGGKAQSLGGIYGVQSFSSECRMNEHYVCGYLNKMSDGKWTKRSWHRRWFVLDRQSGLLSYYRLNPANNMNVATRGTVVHMEDTSSLTLQTGRSTEVPCSSSSSPIKPAENLGGNQSSSTSTSGGSTDPSASLNESGQGNNDERTKSAISEAPTMEVSSSTATNSTSTATLTSTSREKNVLSPASSLVYMNKLHPWYRDEMDLNKESASLLFEKHLARNAPTQFFFQVSSLSLAELETRRGGIQFKLCADNYHDFDRWTQAIAEVINRKVTEKQSQEKNDHPTLTHQQIYRQRLQQQQQQQQQQAKTKGNEEDKAGESDSIANAVLQTEMPTEIKFQGAPTATATATATVTATPTLSLEQKCVMSSPLPKDLLQSPPLHTPTQWRLAIHLEGFEEIVVAGLLFFVACACVMPGWLAFTLVWCYAGTVFLQTTSSPLCTRLGGARTIPEARFDGNCVDPSHCCLHKPASFDLSQATTAAGTSGASLTSRVRTPQVPVRAASESLKKFEMGFSIKKARDDHKTDPSSRHVWAISSADTFMVRCQDYKKSRRKQPSKAAMFEFVGADVIQTNGKIDLISKRVAFPNELADKRLFVVNIQLPSYAPILWGDNTNNGPGYCIVMYWRIPDEIVEELKNPKNTTVRLLKRFLEAGNDTSLTDRFKMIVQVVNHAECGLTGVARKLLVSHNATPLLTRPQHRIYHWNQITEVDIDVHIFSYIARRGLSLLLDKTPQLIVDVAFLVQGETEDELPEQILACGRFNRLNSTMAKTI